MGREFLSQLIQHATTRAGTLSFQVKRVGSRVPSTATLEAHAQSLAGVEIWSQTVSSRLKPVWAMERLQGLVNSDFNRPTMADVICFALDLKGTIVSKLVRPLAMTLLAQLAIWVDENIQLLSLAAVAFHTAVEKNRVTATRARAQALKVSTCARMNLACN